MIMIFMVMNENSKLVSEAQNELGAVQQKSVEQADKIEELSAELADALEMLDKGDLGETLDRLENAESRLEAYQAIDDEVIVLNVGLRNNANHTIRYLTYGKAADPESKVEKPSGTDEDFNKAVNNMKVFVADYVDRISDDNTHPVIVCVVFSYDSSMVYQSDFEAIDTALKNIETLANSENFRYRVNPISG